MEWKVGESVLDFNSGRFREGERQRAGVAVATSQPVNFTRSEALQFPDSIRVAAAVPRFPLRLK